MKKPAFDDIYMDLAVNLAKRSHCIKRHVGAVLVKDTRIISIGYITSEMSQGVSLLRRIKFQHKLCELQILASQFITLKGLKSHLT